MTDTQPHAEGLCDFCGSGQLHHGPWTAEQVAAEALDMGIPPEDFVDCCDDCAVTHVFDGDVEYASRMVGRPLMLTDPKMRIAQLSPEARFIVALFAPLAKEGG